MTACTDKEMALQALFDGELDPVAAASLEEHLRGCAGCRAALARLEAVREALNVEGLREVAPDRLRAKIVARTVGAPARKRFSLRDGAIGAIAAGVLAAVVAPQLAAPSLTTALVDGQVRSVQSGHLVDVETSDRHTVKPWFNGRVDFAPPVFDLKDRGYPLIGGRLDVIQRQNVAVLVFRRHLHTINLFIRPAGAAPLLKTSARQDGYALRGWRAGGLEFWAVSDIEAADLAAFEREFRTAARM
ncbi:zf-HC2 domain-containing protein [Caulobacter sp.]|uniref:anti-sigma factor family protein n=1 Tax=Caulobacter sp. TaxID=78 RepID=UPI001B090037|nr:zf-HC2 domain-containing protein [Caulobacter sp.]MBO9545963.1 anti-sigma factor [Caulobacter sp.]